MTDEPSRDPLLLDRYLANELSPADRARVEAWLSARPADEALLRTMPRDILGAAQLVDSDASWRRLSARIAAPLDDDLADRRARRSAERPIEQRRPWVRRIAAVAAALVVVIGGVATWRITRGGELVAPRGQDVTATLPDGTRLTLAAGSRATWPANFGSRTRDIALEGQGLFDVVHDSTRPFRVTTRDAVAEDVGTRFVVRSWPELASVEVAVDEGLVALMDTVHPRDARTTVLSAGQLGRLMPSGRVQVTTDADVAMAWTRGQLAFDNRPLREVLPALGRRFDVDLRADPSLSDRRLTARFAARSLDEILNAIALSLDLRVVTSGRAFTLTPIIR
ncbi:MAG: FecR domain-containing protein [Gemmatimonadaceae bacterium]|nr:FecR domain-containing protein [Gemmatimonadaceae bacterium]